MDGRQLPHATHAKCCTHPKLQAILQPIHNQTTHSNLLNLPYRPDEGICRGPLSASSTQLYHQMCWGPALSAQAPTSLKVTTYPVHAPPCIIDLAPIINCISEGLPLAAAAAAVVAAAAAAAVAVASMRAAPMPHNRTAPRMLLMVALTGYPPAGATWLTPSPAAPMCQSV